MRIRFLRRSRLLMSRLPGSRLLRSLSLSLLFILISTAGAAQPVPLPPRAEVSWELSRTTFAPGDEGELRVTIDFPENTRHYKQKEFLYLAFTDKALSAGAFGQSDSPKGPVIRLLDIHYPPPDKAGDLFPEYHDSVVLTASFQVDPSAGEGSYLAPVIAAYQLCDDNGICYFPDEEEILVAFTVEGSPVGRASAGDIDGGTPGSTAPGSAGVSLKAFLAALLLALAGGLMLNVMPCVLPVLSIRALNLVRQSSLDRRGAAVNGLVYTAGIVATLLLLGTVTALIKLTGEFAGWGFQFQNPVFTGVLLSFIFLFALSLFDVYVFPAIRFSFPPGTSGSKSNGEKVSGQGNTPSSGYSSSFMNGILAVLLAVPCTAPFLGSALGFAFSLQAPFIPLFFAVIGLGFASPFILLGFFPGFLRFIPKPGAWMNSFKQAMGFVLFGTVIYLLSIIRYQVSPDTLIRLLVFLLILAAAAWIFGKNSFKSKKTRWISLSFSIIMIVLAAGILFQPFRPRTGIENGTVETVSLPPGWSRFDPDKLERARAEAQGVFVAFSARWCAVCKVNEERVLNTDEAVNLFRSTDTLLLYGDYTGRDVVIGDWIRRFGRAGVPVYAYYAPGAAEPEILPEILSIGRLEETLVKLPSALDGEMSFF